jgi:chorismate mutase
MSAESSLSVWRELIDHLDGKILALLNQRAEVVIQIQEWKRRAGRSLVDSARAEQVVANLVAQNPGPLLDTQVREIYEDLLRFFAQPLKESSFDLDAESYNAERALTPVCP